MKKALSCLFALALVLACVWAFPLQADAAKLYSGTCGENLTWNLDATGTLTISGTGKMEDFSSSPTSATAITHPWSEVAESIKAVVIGEGVESIGHMAFMSCTELQTVTIPKSVKSIGIEAFSYCRKLQSVTLPSGLETIGASAFSDCDALTSVTLPDSLTLVGSNAFTDCPNLAVNESASGCYLGSGTNPYFVLLQGYSETFTVHKDTKIIGGGAFTYSSITTATIPDGIKGIGDSAFNNCYELTEVTIPSSVQRIGIGAFSGCISLTTIRVDKNNPAYSSDENGVVFNKDKTELIQMPGAFSGAYTVPSGVKRIGARAFLDNHELTTVTFPDSLKSIGENAFSGCSNLQSITFGSNIESIDAFAFSACSGLTTLTLPDSLKSIGESAFNSCQKLTSVTIPNNLTAIPDSVFYSCSSLTDITLGNSVESIGAYAFSSCSSLEAVTVGNGVKRIGLGAFSYCENLTEISLPDSLEKLEKMVFDGCDNLEYTAYDTAKYLGNSENPHVALIALKSQDITTCTIPAGTKAIADSVFDECPALTKIWVKPENTAYSNDASGVLFNKDKTRLIKAPTTISGAYTIPSGVKQIDARAFYECGTLDITIPASVQTIGEDAFYGDLKNVYITDPNAWCKIQFANNSAHPMYQGDQLHILDAAGNEVEELVLSSDVTAIPDYAFKYGYGLRSITIPDSVRSIGYDAFWNCYKVTTLHLGSGVQYIDYTAFDACSSVTGLWVDADHPLYSNDESGVLFNKDKTVLVQVPDSIYGHYTVPNSVCSIDKGAFSHCSDLAAVTIPNTVKVIGEGAFGYCRGLETMTVPEGVEVLGRGAFSYCENLKEITIPGSVKTIPQHAFSYCENLTKVTFAEGVEIIDSFALSQCPALEELSFPDSVQIIGVIGDCKNLKTVNIGAGTKEIALNAFEDCPSLTAIWVDGNNPAYSSDAKGVLFNKNKTELVQVPAAISGEYTVPGTIYNIGDYAFAQCTGLTAITISEGVGYIGGNAFEGCTGLTSLILPDSVERIDGYAFSGCTGLTAIVLPENAELNGNGIFSGCTGLTQLTIPKDVQTIGRNMFENCTSLKSISLPDSVEMIGPMAFNNCTSLTDVYYAGTQEQWAEIRILNRNDALTNATIHYGHVHAPAGEPSATVEATCTAEGYVEYTCTCGAVYKETIAKLPHSFAEGVCTVCGAAESTPGDLDGVEGVNEDDVIYLLQHLLMPEDFPVNQMVDYDKDNDVDEDDVIYLLQHLLMPDDFPL